MFLIHASNNFFHMEDKVNRREKQIKHMMKTALDLPFSHMGGAPVAFATRNDIAISSQFLENPTYELV